MKEQNSAFGATTYFGNAQALKRFHYTSIPPHPLAPSSNRPYWEGNHLGKTSATLNHILFYFFLISDHSIHHKIIIHPIWHSYFSSSKIFVVVGLKLGPLYTRSKGQKKLGANFEHFWVANWPQVTSMNVTRNTIPRDLSVLQTSWYRLG